MDENKRQRPANKGSELISDEANHRLFEHLAKNTYSLACGVSQLLAADPNPKIWQKKNTGLICLVKDYSCRAYFLRLYDLHKGLLWEQMLYNDFKVACPSPVLLTFEGDVMVYGLNFSQADEAKKFKIQLDKKYEQEQKLKRKSQVVPANYNNNNNDVNFARRPISPPQSQMAHNGAVPSMQSPPAGSGMTQVGVAAPMPAGYGNTGFGKKKKRDKGKNKRLTKDQIGLPTNFVHKVHVGWDADKGLETKGTDGEEMDTTVLEVLSACGFQNITNKEKKFIYDFLEKKGGLEKLKEEVSHKPQLPASQSHGPADTARPLPVAPALNVHSQQQQQRQLPEAQRHTPSPPRAAPVQRPPPPYAGNRTSPRNTVSTKSQAPAPPPPPRDMQQASTASLPQKTQAPPPPPARPLPVPPTSSSAPQLRPAENPPPPPPPPSSTGVTVGGGAPPPPAPPPPPPPPPSAATLSSGGSSGGLPSQSQGRMDLMAEIREGKMLKHVNSASASSNSPSVGGGGDSKSALNREIEQGRKLRPVEKPSETPERRSTPMEMGGIAGALARALAERREQIEDSDDSSDGDDEYEDDDEWDD